MKPLLIVDVTAILFRKYFSGMQHVNIHDVEVGGVWGVCTALRDINKLMKPKYIAAVFDAGPKTFRNEIYPEYKANRGSAPADLIPQFELSYKLCQAVGITCFKQKGFEADDLLASLALRARAQGIPVQLLSNDKDLNQLVIDEFPSIQQVNFFKKQVLTEESIKKSTGVLPRQCIDFMALVGDNADNIRGVDGIGPKTAALLLGKYKTLEGIYSSLPELEKTKKGKRWARLLREFRENCLLAKRLVTLKTDIDLSSQVTDIKEDLRWIDKDAKEFLTEQRLLRYLKDLKPNAF